MFFARAEDLYSALYLYETSYELLYHFHYFGTQFENESFDLAGIIKPEKGVSIANTRKAYFRIGEKVT